MWIDDQDKDRLSDGRKSRCDAGVYTSMDQMLYKENSEDLQGFGAFFRYGWADGKYNAVTNFFSFGISVRRACLMIEMKMCLV